MQLSTLLVILGVVSILWAATVVGVLVWVIRKGNRTERNLAAHAARGPQTPETPRVPYGAK